MKDIVLHTWTQTSKQAGGISVRAFVINLIREGGLTFTATCPEDDACFTEPAFSPRSMKSIKADFTTEQVQEGFTMLLNTLADQNKKIAELTEKVNSLTPKEPVAILLSEPETE